MKSSFVLDWSGIPKLPLLVKTRGGVLFDPRENLWSFRDGMAKIRLDFSDLPLSNDLLLSLKGVLIWFVENRSSHYMQRICRTFAKFVALSRRMSNEQFSLVSGVDVLNFRVAMGSDMKKLISLLRRWALLNYPGLDSDVISTVDKIKVKSNRLGVAVLTLDPWSGPFSSIEQMAIQDALNHAWHAGKISENVFYMSWLLIATGSRPVQLAALKVCDLSLTKSSNDVDVYLIKIPRAKQRNQSLRDSRKPRLLLHQIGKPLYEYCERVRNEYAKIISDENQIPMFPMSSKFDAEAESGWWKYHYTASGISCLIRDSLCGLRVRSERTGEFLNISAIRFRRTLGTNAAQEGHGAHVIAELLDHSGIENVGVYISATPDIAKRIDKAMSLHMAPLAQAFQGTLARRESDVSRLGDPLARIIDLRIDQSGKSMGCCGQSSYCGFLAPVACYTCMSFEAWSDGPHEAVLDHLLKERERYLDKRISAINDRTILAVAEVVLLCRAFEAARHG